MPPGKQNKSKPKRRSANQRYVPQPQKVHKDTLPRGTSDKLILDQVEQILPGKALLILVTGTALAKHLTRLRSEVSWNIFTCEHFYMTAIVNALSEDDEANSNFTEIELFCTPDPPVDEYDTIIFPTDSKGSSEFTRDLLQSAANMLKPTGRLIISTNNPKDHWLLDHLKETFGRTTIIKDKAGVCYIARKKDKPNKQKNFDCEFAFRDGETLIPCASRPGVFSHRRVDAGARALIRSLNLLEHDKRWSKRPPRSIVEMGCGCGSVATATALRFPMARVIAVDSHARAIQSSERTAALNDAKNVVFLLDSGGNVPEPGTHDLFLCNPPYYSDFRISELFLQAAVESLRPGGRLHLVSKLTDWHHNRMIEIFANAEVHRLGDYDVITSVNR